MGNEIGNLLVDGGGAPRVDCARYGAGTIAVDVRPSKARRCRKAQPPPLPPPPELPSLRGPERHLRPPAPVSGAVLELLMETLTERLGEVAPDRADVSFDSCKAPGISITSYLRRLAKWTDTSAEVLAVAVVYVTRYLDSGPHSLHELNVHRLLLTALVVASKVYEEPAFQNSYYAEAGGVILEELNHMEEVLLVALNFELAISMDEVDAALRGELDKHSPAVPRGYDWYWFHGQPICSS
eukprot:TRINITY_DN18532_c0_g1_i1.p1 TRINITY_DN18532_c0_g1~~TRINITY_DN18532_c0_g1_i1.p1  ORF type:complete len:240 (+),score=86.48 TRINITY_DN18532_c0_g1_i1:183-902(+)